MFQIVFEVLISNISKAQKWKVYVSGEKCGRTLRQGEERMKEQGDLLTDKPPHTLI